MLLVRTLAEYVLIANLPASPRCPCCGEPLEKTKPAGVAPYRLLDATRRANRQAIVPEYSILAAAEQVADLFLEVVDADFGSLPVVAARPFGAQPWLSYR